MQTGKKTEAVPSAGCFRTSANGIAVTITAINTVERCWIFVSRTFSSHARPRIKASLANSAGSKLSGPSRSQL